MKIVNFKRFFTFVFVMSVFILVFIFIFNNKVLSKNDIEYVDYQICQYDTLWNIAISIKENNINYIDKDIREIIYEIKKINNMESSDIYFMDIIKIPKI